MDIVLLEFIPLLCLFSTCFSQLAQYRMYTVQIADVERKNSAGEYLTFRFFTTFMAFAMLAVYSIATCRIDTVPAVLLYALYKTAGLVIDVMHANDQVGHRMDYIGKSLIMQGIGSLLSFIVVFGLLNSLEGALLLMTVVTIGIGVIYDYPRSNRISAIKLGITQAKVRAFLCGCLPIVLGGIAASAARIFQAVFILYIRRFCSRHLCISCCSRGNYPNGCDVSSIILY